MTDETPLNAQIADALAQINASLSGAGHGLVTAAAYQAIAHAIALGLQNAVAQQQQTYILRNALTTAAASAILDGKKDEAEAMINMFETRLTSPGLSIEISELLKALRQINEELRNLHAEATSAPPPAPPPSSGQDHPASGEDHQA